MKMLENVDIIQYQSVLLSSVPLLQLDERTVWFGLEGFTSLDVMVKVMGWDWARPGSEPHPQSNPEERTERPASPLLQHLDNSQHISCLSVL